MLLKHRVFSGKKCKEETKIDLIKIGYIGCFHFQYTNIIPNWKTYVHEGKILLITSAFKCQNHAECVVWEIHSKTQMS